MNLRSRDGNLEKNYGKWFRSLRVSEVRVKAEDLESFGHVSYLPEVVRYLGIYIFAEQPV